MATRLGPSQLLVCDGSGRGARRVRLGHGQLRRLTAAAGLLAMAAAGLAGHALALAPAAREARALAQTNQQLADRAAVLERRLPALRGLAREIGRAGGRLRATPGAPPDGARAEAAIDAAGDLGGERDVEASGPGDPGATIARLMGEGEALRLALQECGETAADATMLLASTPALRPAATPWLTSPFGRRRDPLGNRLVMHRGIDLGGSIGVPVRAPADGVVIWTGPRGGYGQAVVIDHGAGLQTHFAHLSRFLVQEGDRVQRGEAIAEMGSTGRSTGPHLHYEVRRDGEPLDPRRFILD